MPPPRPSSHLVLAGISLANLLLLRCWAWVLDPATQYFLDAPRPAGAYVGTILLFVLVSIPAALLASLSRAAKGKAARFLEMAFFATVALAIYCAREQIADLAGRPARSYVEEIDGIEHAIGMLSIAVVALAMLPARSRQIARRTALTLLLVLSPFALVTSVQCALAAVRDAGVYDRKAASPRPGGSPSRVVVVVLDEWDQFLSFEDRKPGLALPTFDALVSAGVHVIRGVSPGSVTETVMPSLLTGRRVVDTADAGHSDRLVRYEDGTVERFSDAETFLSLARERGFDGALVGWYHPYCRVIGDDVVTCRSRAIRQEMDGRSLAGVAAWQATRWLEGAPQGRKILRAGKLPRTLRTNPDWHQESWRLIHAETLSLVRDPQIDIVVAHYPLPHPPSLQGGGYEGNLALADRSLAEILEGLEDAGLAGRTSLIVLADHPKRGPGLAHLASPRLAEGEARPVPILIRIGSGGAPVVIDRPVSTLVLHDLAIAVLEGMIRENDDVEIWLDRDTAAAPSAE